MEQNQSWAFHKFYYIIRLVLSPIISLITIINTFNRLNYFSYYISDDAEALIKVGIFFYVVDIIFSILVASHLKKMTGQFLKMNCTFLFYNMFCIAFGVFSSTFIQNDITKFSESSLLLNFLICIVSALLTWGLCYTLPVCIYYKKRKDFFYDEPEANQEQLENVLNEPINLQNQTVAAIDPIYVVPAQSEQPTTESQTETTTNPLESALLQTKQLTQQPVSKPSPATNKRYCRYCGKELLENTSFCRHCGQKSN